MRGLEFPQPEGGPVWVVYPLLFTPEDGSEEPQEAPVDEPREGTGRVRGVPA